MKTMGTPFDRYLEGLCDTLGHADRRKALKSYCRGMTVPLERKSVEPPAASLQPRRARDLIMDRL